MKFLRTSNSEIKGKRKAANLSPSRQTTAAAIWTLASGGVFLDEIIAAVGRKFSGEPSEIRRETGIFLDLLVEEKLVVPNLDGPTDAARTLPDGPIIAFVTPELQKYTDMEELLLIDPIHQVDEVGWPSMKAKDPAE